MMLKGCNVGGAKLTKGKKLFYKILNTIYCIYSGYNLPAKYIIHTVGPKIKKSKPSFYCQNMLKSCYRNCLILANNHEIRTIVCLFFYCKNFFIFNLHKAFPSISTGAYGYPIEEAAQVALMTVKEFLNSLDNQECVIRELIIFSCFLIEKINLGI